MPTIRTIAELVTRREELVAELAEVRAEIAARAGEVHAPPPHKTASK
jgi:hypothetical protein